MAVAPVSRRTRCSVGAVRAFRREDLPAITRLFDLCYFHGSGAHRPPLEAFLADVFFDAPCQAKSSLSSWVYEDESGRIGGFLGTHPRAFVYNGRPVSAAVCGQLMVHPDLRGRGVAHDLCRPFWDGPQMFSFSGTARRTPTIHLRLGAHRLAFHGLAWRKVLRPGREWIARIARSPRLGSFGRVVHAVARGLRAPQRSCQADSPDLLAVEIVHQCAFRAARLFPAFDIDDLDWRLRTVMAADPAGTFARVVYYSDNPIGWYVWRLDDAGHGTVLEMLSAAGHHVVVARDLFRQARCAGAGSIRGLCSDVAEAIAVQQAGASISYHHTSYLIHSRNADLLHLFLDAPPRLSVFDGEGWLRFPGSPPGTSP